MAGGGVMKKSKVPKLAPLNNCWGELFPSTESLSFLWKLGDCVSPILDDFGAFSLELLLMKKRGFGEVPRPFICSPEFVHQFRDVYPHQITRSF